MNPLNIIGIGDSWISSINATTGKDRDGWMQMLGVPEQQNYGIAGSKAEEWATGIHNDTLNDIAKDISGKNVIVSLLGNDARAAYEDGKVTQDEVVRALGALRAVISGIKRCNPQTIHVMLYADPLGNDVSSVAVPLININIRTATMFIGCGFIDCPAFLHSAHDLT